MVKNTNRYDDLLDTIIAYGATRFLYGWRLCRSPASAERTVKLGQDADRLLLQLAATVRELAAEAGEDGP